MQTNKQRYLHAFYQVFREIRFECMQEKAYSFEALFYPIHIDEGKYAFQSYAEQMERAKHYPRAGIDAASDTQDTNSASNALVQTLRSMQQRVAQQSEKRSNQEHSFEMLAPESESEEEAPLLSKVTALRIAAENSALEEEHARKHAAERTSKTAAVRAPAPTAPKPIDASALKARLAARRSAMEQLPTPKTPEPEETPDTTSAECTTPIQRAAALKARLATRRSVLAQMPAPKHEPLKEETPASDQNALLETDPLAPKSPHKESDTDALSNLIAKLRSKSAKTTQSDQCEEIPEEPSEDIDPAVFAADKTLLYDEPEFPHESLVLSAEEATSRILLIASAGHGKTTFLKRIGLHYAQNFALHSDVARAFGARYALPSDELIPCYIRLRNVRDASVCIERLMMQSMDEILTNAPQELFSHSALCAKIIESLLQDPEQFLLLIDGLDELSDAVRLPFLRQLQTYLSQYPKTRVILSSRVAGLSEEGITEALTEMHFRGRSLMSLTDDQCEAYAAHWIDHTQEEADRASLKENLREVLEQKRFAYLKEMLCTPLELLIFLKGLANGSLALNRFQMFRDALWEKFTNHVQNLSQKRAVFEDFMTLVSFIAYDMQCSEALFLSQSRLATCLHRLQQLNFHTDLFGEGTLTDYLRVLNELAANSGLIEKDDRGEEVCYTFPIRANQEFLAAYACCHLALDEEATRPEPLDMVRTHLTESRWYGVINFILSDLDNTSHHEFDRVLPYVFAHDTSLEHLRMVIESDVSITREHAQVLCEATLRDAYLTIAQRELLLACMDAPSSYAFAHALRILYQENNTKEYDNHGDFLEACALAAVAENYRTGASAFDDAFDELSFGTQASAALGAAMIDTLIHIVIDEQLPRFAQDVRGDFIVSDQLLDILYDNASTYHDPASVKALSNIAVSNYEGCERAHARLDLKLFALTRAALEAKKDAARKLLLCGNGMRKARSFVELRALVYTLGSFPFHSEALRGTQPCDPYIALFMDAMYLEARMRLRVNEVAIALACGYYCWSETQFIHAWQMDVCKGCPSETIWKGDTRVREQNLFALVRVDVDTFIDATTAVDAQNIRLDKDYNYAKL